MRKQLDELDRVRQGKESFTAAIRKFMQMERLTAPLLRELIDHIDVYEVEGTGKNKTQRIVIYYRFVGYIDIPKHLKQNNYKEETRKGVEIEYISNTKSA